MRLGAVPGAKEVCACHGGCPVPGFSTELCKGHGMCTVVVQRRCDSGCMDVCDVRSKYPCVDDKTPQLCA
jgi:hypothetical protein